MRLKTSIKALLSSFFSVFMMTISSWSHALTPYAEVMHFLISDGELSAIYVLRDEFISRGGEWSESHSLDYQHMKRDAFMRIGSGFPPSAMLWLSGEDLEHLSTLSITRDMNEIAKLDGWDDKVYPFVLDRIRVEEHYIAAPLSIHNENWSWYNLGIYQKLGLNTPGTWDEFLRQAPIIQAAGYVPLAISEQDWNIRLLFTTMMAGVAGPVLYRRFYFDHDPKVLDHPSFRRVLTLMSQLKKYQPKPGIAKTWNEATALVIENKAAMQVMGDWAKGEFISAGKQLGVDYACETTPEAEQEFIAAIDLLVFPEMRKADARSGQRLLTKVLMDKQTQLEYAEKKGSMPIRHDVDPQQLDPCARKTLAKMTNIEHRLLSPRLTMNEQLRISVQKIIAEFWKSDAISIDITIEMLKKRFDKTPEKI